MKNRAFLLTGLAAVCLLVAWPRPAAAYIDFRPPTLGDLCRQATHIYVVKVDKVSAERGVIIFKLLEQLKGKEAPPLPDTTFAKQLVRSNVNGAKVVLDWAAEGKRAVVFAKDGGVKSVAHVYIDSYWYLVGWNVDARCWVAWNGEPTMLTRYCGTADQLGNTVAKILRGEEVVVPGMVSDDRKALAERRAKVQDLRASLQILGNPKENIDLDTKPDPGVKKINDDKPTQGEKKPAVRMPDRLGTVKALAADGKSFTLQPAPTVKNKEPAPIEIQLHKEAKIMAGKLAVGQAVSLWLQKGSENVAVEVQIGQFADKSQNPSAPGVKPVKPAPDANEKKPEKPAKPPVPGDKPGKPALEANDKPEPPQKPKAPAKPARDPVPTATLIDNEIDRKLAALEVPASGQADDAEFLRRVTLDLTGRIPTYQRTIAFLDSKDPDKRRQLIDELLETPEYGEHFGSIWRNLLGGRNPPAGEKGGGGGDALRPWLAEQWNANRGWNAIVTDLLTAEGTPRDNPATAFLLANAENGRPQPNKVTGAVAAMFLGVNLRCAECHKHPFAQWKQTDFWGTAAFFGKLQYGGGKGGPASLAESLAAGGSTKEKGQPVIAIRGAAIVIPAASGKSAGQVVKARFLGAAEAVLDEKEPFRPRFAAWATAADNPYFARAAVNRMWAHFFGRGFVNPLDSLDTNAPSHPELLDRLTKEFAASGFDLKHLARCITTSKAYQRSHLTEPGNETDVTAFSHMAVKVLTPEVLYESLGIIGKDSGSGGNGGGKAGKPSGDKQESKDQFVRSFRVEEDVPAVDYIQGIPQLLRLMNASSPNRGSALVAKLSNSGASRTEAIATLYLTTLSRRPTTAETELMSSYLSRRKDDREGYRGVLWILLNSSEFALNH
ncbi:MAG TPA: DUF1549 domain-containing protein [Gemmataceae bacterium]|nr:DUF1549 domain-containing protein [Gemmataceae bacterium]